MKYSFSKLTVLAAAIYVVLMIGCDAGTKNDHVVTTSSNEDSLDRKSATLSGGIGTGYLDTLYMTTNEFKSLTENKASFIFYFGIKDTITVHGWNDKGRQGTTDAPVVKFRGWKKSKTVSYGPQTYFGNLLIKNVNNLQIKLRPYNYVILAPYIIRDHIYYKLYGSQDASLINGQPMALVLLDEVNPSPPKSFD